ncbi:MAG TPA: Hint domain-containing protein, partial [Alphaproteobacteria bacterium]|nr:Hint domain-containing protein [Alphaproteobacteria bacterium]
MAGRTISGTYSVQVTLTSAGDNPATIDPGALLQAGLYGSAFAQWVITNQGIVQGATAIALEAGGTVLNQDLIDGTAVGVYLVSPGLVTNAGTVTADGASGVGIGLRGGGTVVNQSQGTIGGVLYGVGSSNFVTVTNYGLIGPAADIGVATSSGLITNMAGGTVQGTNNGVRIYDGGTVENAGTIAGGVAAVHIYAGATGRVIVDPGAVFLGTVDGGNAPAASFVSTLEFAAGTAGAVGTLDGSNTQFIDFEQIIVDPNAHWDVGTGAALSAGVTLTVDGILDAGISGTTIANYGVVDIGNGGVLTLAGDLSGTGPVTIEANGTFAATGSVAATESVTFTGPNGLLQIADTTSFDAGINGFAPGDKIDLTGLTFAVGATASISGGVLSITSGGITDTLLASGLADDTRFSTVAIPGETGTELGVLCFCAGTRIRTPSGEIPVEHLKTGDPVLTYAGTSRPIAWIGTGRVLVTRGRRTAATPVILRKEALADNIPYEDLRVTKGHAFYVDGVLIPVEFLVNHRSICWDDRAREVTLYHVELETHDVLIANGAPAESYRDDGNRWLFQNANTGWD